MIGRVFNSNFNFIHLSLIANTGALSEYSTIEETISPEVLEDIANWINGLYN